MSAFILTVSGSLILSKTLGN